MPAAIEPFLQTGSLLSKEGRGRFTVTPFSRRRDAISPSINLSSRSIFTINADLFLRGEKQ